MAQLRIGHGETDTLFISRTLRARGAGCQCVLHQQSPEIKQEDLIFVLDFCCYDGQDSFETELDIDPLM